MMSKKNQPILIILASAFLLLFTLLSLFFHNYTNHYAIKEAEKLVQDLLLTHRAIHKYVNTISRPELFRLKDAGLLYKDYFSPKTMSFTYTARGIKRFLNEERKKAGLAEIYFKLASNNPRNEINRADKQEAQLLKLMNTGVIEDFRKIVKNPDGKPFLYIAIPTKPITKSCLKCHGDPSDAPKEMVALYPESSGYYEKEGDVRALISIRIPLERHMQDGFRISTIFIIILFLALLLIYILIWYFIHRINQQQQLIVEQNLELEHMATHDVLTGLPNRRHFKEYSENKISQGQRSHKQVAFLYIDLDSFKAINDEISHQAGDMVLTTLAKRFQTFVRKNEMIARIGGDEFCMIIYGHKDTNELEKTAKRLIKECTKSITVDGMEFKVGMSIGIAIYPDDGETYDDLMSMADDAMYRVKNNIKGTYEFVK